MSYFEQLGKAEYDWTRSLDDGSEAHGDLYVDPRGQVFFLTPEQAKLGAGDLPRRDQS